jgi:hypothetical protein
MKTDLYTKVIMTVFVMAFCLLSYSAYLIAKNSGQLYLNGSIDNHQYEHPDLRQRNK